MTVARHARVWAAITLGIILCLAVTPAFAASPGTLVDAGFESGTDGAALNPAIWTLFGAPARAEYDNTLAKNGSQSGWLQGNGTGQTGVIESQTGGMSSDGAEIRFWAYCDTTATRRTVDDIDATINNAARGFLVDFQEGGALRVYTSKVGNPNGYTTNAYTPVGTYTTGWTQYRLVLDFTSQTYTLSSRTNAADVWTPLKAAGATGYAIPMLSASTVTATHGTRWRCVNAAQMWVDDLAYSPTGIAPAAPSGLVATPGTAQVALSWNANTEPDLVGYRVYRDGALVTPVPIPAPSYTDSLLPPGTYSYQVSAVDSAGGESGRSPAAVATVASPSTGTLVDAGFESGTDGAALNPAIWTLFGAPARAEYDNTLAKNGSQSGWLQGNGTGQTGVIESQTGGMSSDGAEIRFWAYCDTTATRRTVDDIDATINNAARGFLVDFQEGGALRVYTSKAGNPNGYTTNAYTPVGTYTTGWTQYRLVLNFTSQTYTLSSRTNAADVWTPLKAAGATGYAIPMLSASTVTATHGTRWRCVNAAQMWVDDLAYSPPGIPDVFGPYAITATAGPNGSIDPSGTTEVAHGGSQSYTIAPNPGYGIAQVLVDGVSVGAVSTYTFSDVSANHTISAVFAINPTGEDMPITYINCESCHAPGSPLDEHDHPCADCHAVTDGHPGTPSDMHIPADVTGCTPCHDSSLTIEHNGRTPDAGGTFVCATCHGSTDPAVVGAIAASNSACSACHPGADAGHVATHDTLTPAVSCQDVGCHPGTNLLPIHSALTCAQCHESSNPIVISAIAAGDKQCATCHPSAETDHVAFHQTATPPVSCQDVGCHPGTNLLPIHSALTCAQCHESSDPAVTGAIAAGDTRCASCHFGGGAHVAVHEGGLIRPDCLDCHKANISQEHEDNCDKCHKSTDPAVIAAIAAGHVTCASCHDPGIHPAGFWGIKTDYYQWTTTPGPRDSGPALGTIGDNAANPGVHGNYLATTAKCGVCHSVHRAVGQGTKLLPTDNTTCACCHTGGTTVSAKLVTWTPYDVNWVPEVDPADPLYPVGGPAWMAATPAQRTAAITNKVDAGGAANGGGPHNDSALDLVADGYWDGTGATPEPGYETGHRYGCATRRCHASNPHGADSSKYKLFAAKLLFNESANNDLEGDGTYGGLDAVWDDLGATDAAVERFVSNNSSIVSTTAAGDILIHGVAPDANETHALVAGLTCGRPSNPSTGEDECHAEASYAIVDKGIKENRNHGTGITSGSAYRTDNTGAEALGYGGNDNRDSKTGHVAGTFAAVPGAASYAPIAGCTSCHDQTDSANTVTGNFTFPHGQVAAGASNITSDGVLPYTGRVRVWMGYAGAAGEAMRPVTSTAQKAYDGNCLKCHRDAAGNGIGLTR